MKRLATWYPLLLAAFPVLGIAARNPGAYALGDLLVMLAVVVVAFAGILGIATLLLRRFGQQVPAWATALLALLFFFYVPLREWVDRWIQGTVFDHGGLAAVVLGSAVAAVGTAMARRPARLEAVTRVLSVMGLLLVGWTGARVALHHLHREGAMPDSPLARELARPVPTRGRPAAPLRDIYLIILDSYASPPVLQEQFGFDDRPFVDSLRALGFTVPATTRSNYDFTEVSLPSILNFTHMTPLEREVGGSIDRTLSRYLVRENRLARFLKAQGYRHVLIPAGWDGTAASPQADRVIRRTGRLALADELDRTELRSVLYRSTLLSRVVPEGRSAGPTWLLSAFDALTTVPADTAPTFTLAHFLMPHRPFRLDAHCRQTPPPLWKPAQPSSVYDKAYIGQVRCANRRVLATVGAILQRSTVPPVIVIQADHGSRRLLDTMRSTPEGFRALARERFGALGAYYLPGGGDREFGDTVTAVNVFRHILTYYFGADLPPEPDEAYFQATDGSYRFTRADTALAPPSHASR